MGCVPPEREAINIAHTRSLNLPYVNEKDRPPLAVVGGGHSVVQFLDLLRNWQGDIWACGSAFHWCCANGIEATFFCVDPQPETASLAVGAKKAILCTSIDPAVFDVLKAAEVEVFDLVHEADTSNHGATTATAAPHLAIQMGYSDVTFFGCESSYPEGASHAYHNEAMEHTIRVACNAGCFVTNPGYLLQAEFLATMIRLLPGVLKERSGGLLGAMVQDIEYDITHGSPSLHKVLAA